MKLLLPGVIDFTVVFQTPILNLHINLHILSSRNLTKYFFYFSFTNIPTLYTQGVSFYKKHINKQNV